MGIIRCSEQENISLHEFYERTKGNLVSERMANEMQRIISWLNETFIETQIYGLTSHYQLQLLTEDSSLSKSYVKLIADPIRHRIEYLVPKELAPWKDAYISGWTDNLEEAKKYIIIAMKNSKGWENSEELQALSIST